MNKRLKKIYEFFLSPFTVNGSFLLILVYLVCSVDVIGYISYGAYVYSGILGLHGFFMCYVIVLVGHLLQTKFQKLYQIFWFILGYINLVIDTSIHVTCRTNFSKDMVAIIYGTNACESREFIQNYFSSEFYVYIITLVLISYILFNIRSFLDYLCKIPLVKIILLCITFIGGIWLFIHKPSHWEGVFVGKIYSFISYQRPPKLSDYLSNPKVELDDDKAPDNVVIIIGESFTKYHSSLYGYEKETNPNLYNLITDSLLVVYDTVQSNATTTIKSFVSMLSMHDAVNSKEWYEYPTLIEIMSLAGYNTIWISNQSPSGLVDNVIAEYANLCDTICWVGNKYNGHFKTDYDGEIINYVNSIKDSNSLKSKNLFIIHLMGSHPAFRARYPEAYKIFTEEDYETYPETQRLLLAEYDNSILYNDYVVKELLDSFSKDETIAFYLSDHGLDMFYTSNKYCGHARSGDKESIKLSKQIPFFVYYSPVYKASHRTQVQDIKQRKSEPLTTDEFMLFLFNILNLKTDFNDVVTER